jgi:peptidoglycan-associated lipoprotein
MMGDKAMRAAYRMVAVVALVTVAAACARRSEPPVPAPQAPAPVAVTPAPMPAPVGPAPVTTPVAPQFAPGSQQDLIATVGTDRVFFAYDSDVLDATSQDVLRRQAEWLARYPQVSVTIEGHADERGTREYNLALGDRRAESVKSFLAGLGVSEGRVETISYGKERPDAIGSTEEAYAKNRRGVTVVQGGNRALSAVPSATPSLAMARN